MVQAMGSASLHPSRTPVSRLVVIKPGALGDTLLLAPCLRAVISADPGLEITIIGTMPYAAFLGLFGVAHRVISIDQYRLFGPDPKDREIMAHAVVMAFLPDPDPVSRARLAAKGADRLIFKPAIPLQGPLHVVRHLYASLRELIPFMGELSKEPFRAPSVAPVISGPYAVISPGAGGEQKRMPLSAFIRIAWNCHQKGVGPVFLAGDTEVDSGLVKQFPRRFPCLVTPEPDRLAALLSGAEKVFANDSGVAHLSALLGTETHVFFGPTDPEQWLPWGERVVLHGFSAQHPTRPRLIGVDRWV